ncbi:hypothetical protein [Niameybacter massiliensis]|uniref:hypothetical protein n=1 Tax=Niameybacter massiliensis TaxID=1658108 RepID=UPI0006B4EFB0|nr:hypothetical protein [Niameybacter massiliensis]
MKKEWKIPQVMGLGVQSTHEDEDLNANAKIFYACKYCCERFWTKNARNEHELTCARRPVPPIAGEGDGDPIPTFS